MEITCFILHVNVKENSFDIKLTRNDFFGMDAVRYFFLLRDLF